MNLINLSALLLIYSGAAILAAALFLVRQLVAGLPNLPLRRNWMILSGLIIFFLLGYLVFGVLYGNGLEDFPDLLVPAIFFFGAGFVWMTIHLALNTAENVRRLVRLEEENITDQLVGIYNRRYFDRRLSEEFARARRYQLELSLLLLDLDHFKLVNDRYGHLSGDQVLREYGGVILRAVRASDIAARFGGDEIMIIAPNTAREEALKLAERIRSEIESHSLLQAASPAIAPDKTFQVTVSIGISGLVAGINSVDELISVADQALYTAKEAGRNRVFQQDHPLQ